MRKTAAFLLLMALFGSVSLAESSPADEARLGWHGEVMPEGLERGETQGDYLWAKDGSIMVYVPPGEFTMGSEKGDPDELPVRQVHLDGYYIDKYEVTWRQWRLAGLPEPRDIDGGPVPEHKPFWGRGDKLPVTYMKWHDAKAYTAWVGKRLPTEAEWEKAARGTDGREFPWGNEPPTFERAVWKEHPIGKESPAPVDCCEAGVSPYGVYNMAGNAWEWCEDWYDSKFYAKGPDRNPINLQKRRHKVLRGGAFILDPKDLRAPLRYRQWATEGQDYVGFRSALSQSPESPSEER